MSATIYYLSDYAHARRRMRRAPVAEDDHRQRAAATFGILIFAVVLIVIGVVLVEGIASVGRSNSDCLQSGRRACGLFRTAFVDDAVQRDVFNPDVVEMSHVAAHQAH